MTSSSNISSGLLNLNTKKTLRTWNNTKFLKNLSLINTWNQEALIPLFGDWTSKPLKHPPLFKELTYYDSPIMWNETWANIMTTIQSSKKKKKMMLNWKVMLNLISMMKGLLKVHLNQKNLKVNSQHMILDLLSLKLRNRQLRMIHLLLQGLNLKHNQLYLLQIPNLDLLMIKRKSWVIKQN